MSATPARCYLRCIKATLSGCLLALCVTGASASDEIIAADWVARCAATDEQYDPCAATVSKVVTLVDNYQYQSPFHRLLETAAPAVNGDVRLPHRCLGLRIGFSTVQYLRDNPSAAKCPHGRDAAAFELRWPCGGVGPAR